MTIPAHIWYLNDLMDAYADAKAEADKFQAAAIEASKKAGESGGIANAIYRRITDLIDGVDCTACDGTGTEPHIADTPGFQCKECVGAGRVPRPRPGHA